MKNLGQQFFQMIGNMLADAVVGFSNHVMNFICNDAVGQPRPIFVDKRPPDAWIDTTDLRR